MKTNIDTYVDGFVLPVPTDKLEDYRAMSAKAAVVWKEYGALDYKECVLDDTTPAEGLRSFPEIAGAKEGETVIFAYIVYNSRAHRDEVNAKVMADPRLQEMCPMSNPDAVMPFDPSRMACGGFQAIVSA